MEEEATGIESAFSFSCTCCLASLISLTGSILTRRGAPILRAVLLKPVEWGSRAAEAAGVDEEGKAIEPEEVLCNKRGAVAGSGIIEGTLSERVSDDRREGMGDSKAAAGDARSEEDAGGLDEPIRTHSPC